MIVCFGLAGLSVEAKDNPKKPVQIFMGGQQYQSFDNYRDDRLKKQWIQGIGPKEYANLQEYLAEIHGIDDPKAQQELSKNQLEQYYAEYRKYLKNAEESGVQTIYTENKSQQGDTEDPMQDMEDLLRQLQATNSDAQAIEIDPKKMKTIEIKPNPSK